jgi:DNA-3-methyladenine glycosylase I
MMPGGQAADGAAVMERCWGGDPRDPLMTRYHDEEWGVAVHDDVELFERLALESFQAGLSWSTILHKREAFRRAFEGFDPELVARFGEVDRARLLGDAGIVRNRAKIEATIGNAGRIIALQAEHGSFDAYLSARVARPGRTLPPGATRADVPATSPDSDALASDLRRRGFRFVGSTVVYAFMQSVGLVDDHLPGCHRYRGARA